MNKIKSIFSKKIWEYVGYGCCFLIIVSAILFGIYKFNKYFSDVEKMILDTSTVYDSLSTSDIKITVNNQILDINPLYNHQTLSAKTLNIEYKTIIENQTKDQDIQVFINDKELKKSTEIQINELAKNQYIDLKIKKGNDQRQYQISTLPDSFFETELSGHSPYVGDYYSNYLNDEGDSFVYKMDNEGHIVYYYMGNYHGEGSVMNFDKHIVNGKVRYSFFEPVEKSNLHMTNGLNYGEIVILNEKYEEIDRVRLLPSKTLAKEELTENHEFLYLGENHYIVTGAIHKTIMVNEKTVRVKASYLQEVKDKKVIFEWDSTQDDTLTQDGISLDNYNNDSFIDYIHINSVDIDPKDNNLVLSLRNVDSVIKIDRTTGKTIWRLGGASDQFHLTDKQKFSKQHYAKYLDDGSILLFDNGTDKKQTYIMKFQLDEQNKSIINYQSFYLDGYYSPACGSVQKLDQDKNVYIIGWGYREGMCVMSEVDFDNDKILAEIIGPHNIQTYRTLKRK